MLRHGSEACANRAGWEQKRRKASLFVGTSKHCEEKGIVSCSEPASCHTPTDCHVQVAAFVECYMPAYKAYLPGMYLKGPTTAKADRLLMLEIDEHRGLVPEQPACPL